MGQNVCENLLDIFAGVGVRDIFGVTGDALNAFLEAIRKDGRFELVSSYDTERLGRRLGPQIVKIGVLTRPI